MQSYAYGARKRGLDAIDPSTSHPHPQNHSHSLSISYSPRHTSTHAYPSAHTYGDEHEHAGPSERPRKRSSLESHKSHKSSSSQNVQPRTPTIPNVSSIPSMRSNTAVQAWELYQRLKLNAKAGIKKPDASVRPVTAQGISWAVPVDGVDNRPAPCHATTGSGRVYKPNISHLEMIRVVLAGSLERQLHLEDIYAAVEARWPYYKDNKSNWKASIRHNLSRHECFTSVPDADGHGNRARGGLWSLCDAEGRPRI